MNVSLKKESKVTDFGRKLYDYYNFEMEEIYKYKQSGNEYFTIFLNDIKVGFVIV
jgi:hypothetical protein